MIASIVVAAAYACLAVISVLLVLIDLRTHRLPNRVVLPGYLAGSILFAVAALLSADVGRLVRAAAAMAVLFVCYFVVRLVSPASLGGGDVKLAGLLGLYLGWVGWDAVLIATIATFLIGGFHALLLLSLRRADRRTRIPFGPALIGGAWAALLVTGLPEAIGAIWR